MTLQTQPIETAPKDGTPILVYAKWNWEKSVDEGEYSWRVCEWADGMTWNANMENFIGLFCSITSNPYSDYAYEPTHWVELPVGDPK